MSKCVKLNEELHKGRCVAEELEWGKADHIANVKESITATKRRMNATRKEQGDEEAIDEELDVLVAADVVYS